MRFLLVLILSFGSLMASAEEIKTQIHSIDKGNGNEETLVFLASGHVVNFPQTDKSTMRIIENGLRNQTWFAITINDQREITDLREISSPITRDTPLKFLRVSEGFVPSILGNLDQARLLFYEARTGAQKESQCFNRAHVWAYEWRINHQLYSSKAWVFFTRKFIRKYKFEWWFHVAPMVHVVVDGQVKERVMDVKYAQGPLSLKKWTDIFMRDRADCPVVEKYTDHANFPESGSCFLMKSSMYYYQPVDLEEKEITGLEKDRWLPNEVRHAYKDAFEIAL